MVMKLKQKTVLLAALNVLTGRESFVPNRHELDLGVKTGSPFSHIIYSPVRNLLSVLLVLGPI